MRYFIGYLIRGEASEYYRTTCAELAGHFGIENISSIVPPYVTIKAPFERGTIEAIDDILSLSTDMPAQPIEFSGWNHFTTRTIFLDIPKPSNELKNFVKEILAKISSTGVPVAPQEFNPHLHMSIARFLKPNQYQEVWKYLQSTPSPKFELKLDNLTIFFKENKDQKAWKVWKTYPLMGKSLQNLNA